MIAMPLQNAGSAHGRAPTANPPGRLRGLAWAASVRQHSRLCNARGSAAWVPQNLPEPSLSHPTQSPACAWHRPQIPTCRTPPLLPSRDLKPRSPPTHAARRGALPLLPHPLRLFHRPHCLLPGHYLGGARPPHVHDLGHTGEPVLPCTAYAVAFCSCFVPAGVLGRPATPVAQHLHLPWPCQASRRALFALCRARLRRGRRS